MISASCGQFISASASSGRVSARIILFSDSSAATNVPSCRCMSFRYVPASSHWATCLWHPYGSRHGLTTRSSEPALRSGSQSHGSGHPHSSQFFTVVLSAQRRSLSLGRWASLPLPVFARLAADGRSCGVFARGSGCCRSRCFPASGCRASLASPACQPHCTD